MAKKYTLAKDQNISFNGLRKSQKQKKSLPEHELVEFFDTGEIETEEDVEMEVIPVALKAPPARSARQKRRRSYLVSSLIQLVAVSVFLVSLGLLGTNVRGYLVDAENNDSIANYVGNGTVYATPTREVPAYPETAAASEAITYPVDDSPTMERLANLKKLNKDFQYWFYIDGMDITYPVMQTPDNLFYLRRNFDKQSSTAGCLFMDYRNDPVGMKGNNIIYGHDMRNGTMFGQLKKFKEKSFFNSHKYVYTYNPESGLATVWQIYSVYVTTTENYYIKTDFYSSEEYLRFIQGTQQNSMFSTNVLLTASSDILTLSTCHKSTSPIGRLVVHAVKLGTCPLL